MRYNENEWNLLPGDLYGRALKDAEKGQVLGYVFFNKKTTKKRKTAGGDGAKKAKKVKKEMNEKKEGKKGGKKAVNEKESSTDDVLDIFFQSAFEQYDNEEAEVNAVLQNQILRQQQLQRAQETVQRHHGEWTRIQAQAQAQMGIVASTNPLVVPTNPLLGMPMPLQMPGNMGVIMRGVQGTSNVGDMEAAFEGFEGMEWDGGK